MTIFRIVVTLVFIWPILRKYFDSPTITTIGTTNYPIWKVGIEISFRARIILLDFERK